MSKARQDIPQTEDSVARAKADCEAARDEARRTTGLEIGPDGFARLSQGSCLDDIEHLIDVHGLRAFLGAAAKAAAGRHIVVSFHDTDRVASLLDGGQ